MKRITLIIIAVILSMPTFAQKDVTKFLGIPVDGTVREMKAQLKKKGFREDYGGSDYLVGRFNGKDVNVCVGENKSHVYRIMVCDKGTVGETDIRINFNNLCSQFLNNKKYVHFQADSTYFIPDNENISLEMAVHNKRYEASFYQINTDTAYIQRCLIETALSKYPKALRNKSLAFQLSNGMN